MLIVSGKLTKRNYYDALKLLNYLKAIAPLITSGNVRAMEYHEGKIFVLLQLPDFNLNHQLRIINERFLLTRRNELISVRGLVLSVNNFFLEAIVIAVIIMASI